MWPILDSVTLSGNTQYSTMVVAATSTRNKSLEAKAKSDTGNISGHSQVVSPWDPSTNSVLIPDTIDKPWNDDNPDVPSHDNSEDLDKFCKNVLDD